MRARSHLLVLRHLDELVGVAPGRVLVVVPEHLGAVRVGGHLLDGAEAALGPLLGGLEAPDAVAGRGVAKGSSIFRSEFLRLPSTTPIASPRRDLSISKVDGRIDAGFLKTTFSLL